MTDLSSGGRHLVSLIAVARKEWLQIVRYPAKLLSPLLWPIILLVDNFLVAQSFGATENALTSRLLNMWQIRDVRSFLLVGTVLWLWTHEILWSTGLVIRSEQTRGTLEETWMTPVSRVVLLLGHTIAQVFFTLCWLILTVVESYVLMGTRLVGNILIMITVFLVSSLAFYGLGLLFSVVVLFLQDASGLIQIVRPLLALLCGVTYPVELLPAPLRVLSEAVPLTHTLRGMRFALEPLRYDAAVAEIAWLGTFALGAWVLAIWAFSKAEKRARMIGSLGRL